MLATLRIETEKEQRDASPPYLWNVRITIHIVSLKEGRVRHKWQDPSPSQRLLLQRKQNCSIDEHSIPYNVVVKRHHAISLKEGRVRYGWQDLSPSQSLLLHKEQFRTKIEHRTVNSDAATTIVSLKEGGVRHK